MNQNKVEEEKTRQTKPRRRGILDLKVDEREENIGDKRRPMNTRREEWAQFYTKGEMRKPDVTGIHAGGGRYDDERGWK